MDKLKTKVMSDPERFNWIETPEFKHTLCFGFECKICNKVELIDGSEPPQLPICDQCLSDLKKIILHQRT